MRFENNKMQDFISVSLQQDALGSHFPAFSCNKEEGKEDRKRRGREGNKATLISLQHLEAYKKKTKPSPNTMVLQYTPGSWQHYVRHAERSTFAVILPGN